MKQIETSILAILAATFLSVGGSGKAGGYHDMACKPKPSSAEALMVCKTRGASGGNVEVTCQRGASVDLSHTVYTCGATIRDWGQASPYAHTSKTWQCAAGTSEIFLFSSDFMQDRTRCDIICGRCEQGWMVAP